MKYHDIITYITDAEVKHLIAGKKIAGIICEYNPFHNGHKYQIEKTKSECDCEYVICAMSGSMVQRGDVAIYDKWVRARAAVQNGADLVVELPCYYVLQSAKNFALGGVELLSRLGVVDVLSFGSETGDTSHLMQTAKILSDEPEEFKSVLEKHLDEGLGYPSAFQKALSTIGIAELGPNDILGANYIAALKTLGSSIEPFVIKRNVPYHSEEAIKNDFASATAIRAMIETGKDISEYVPDKTEYATYDLHNIESMILGFFRLCDPKQIKNIIGMEEGLENRLISAARKATSLDEFVELVVSKRYTTHRVRRVMLACIMGMSGARQMDYVRILAFNQKGRELLGEIKKKTDLKIITKTADSKQRADSMFEFDILATDIAALCCADSTLKISGRDFLKSVEIAD